MQKPCTHGLQNKKAMKSFDFTASTLDIPSRWDPRAKQSRTVALLAALCAAAEYLRRAGEAAGNVVCVLPDSGSRYLSTGIYD